MIPKYRVWITYGYTEEDLKNPDMTDEIKETGLGFMGTPDLIDFRNYEIRVKYDCDWYDSDRFTLMQSTGFKDKNGTEIYDEDIVSLGDGELASVYFEEGTYWVQSDFRDDFLKDWYEVCEVVGNTFENPNIIADERMPIRLRAWDKVNRKMIPVSSIVFWMKEIRLIEGNKIYSISGNDVILMRGTEVKIDGMEIFEGDILKGTYYSCGKGNYEINGEVVYKNGKFVCCGQDVYDLSLDKRVKIVGNIYENPELIE